MKCRGGGAGKGGTGEGALFPAEASPSPFPLASTRRELTDNTERSGSWLGNESSCCVNRKQQQEPWAQFTHTWHWARQQGVKSREGADALPLLRAAVLLMQRAPRSVISRKLAPVVGVGGPWLQRWSPVFYMNRGEKNPKQILPPV